MLFAADSQKPFPGVRKGNFSIEEVNYSESANFSWSSRILAKTTFNTDLNTFSNFLDFIPGSHQWFKIKTSQITPQIITHWLQWCHYYWKICLGAVFRILVCWKYHFWASRFQNFLGKDVQDPPNKLTPLVWVFSPPQLKLCLDFKIFQTTAICLLSCLNCMKK